jgi:hypothetical protein
MSENNPVFWIQSLLGQLGSTCFALVGVIPKNFQLGT